MKEIPVLLLTGYLGSGKTTLVNKILANTKGIKFAVIVNDIGEVNIDADLIGKGGVVGLKDDSLVALQNGCICCTLKMDLVQQLRDIAATGRFDYIVVEASGVCEPEPIARTICSIPAMGSEVNRYGTPRLDCIVTVVDALRMRDEFACAKDLLRGNLGEDDIESLVIQQIEFCDVILLNKASMVSEEDLSTLRSIIRQLQSRAEIIECDYADVDIDRIVGTGRFDYESVSGSAGWVEGVEGEVEENEEEGEADEYGIGTFVYCSRPPLDINKFDNFVAKHWPAGIIRVKGLCYFADDTDNCYLFEQAGTQISMKKAGQWYATMPAVDLQNALMSDPILRRDWDDVYGDRMQKLVFIGRNLDKAAIASALDACLSDKGIQ